MELKDFLDLFNRKERYHLLKNALHESFQLSDEFSRELGDAINVKVPKNAWVAMDYHLDWISVAVASFLRGYSPKHRGTLDRIDGKQFKSTQQDIDLVVAFTVGQMNHLVLIEAKAYEQKWTNYTYDRQLKSKLERLQHIFKQPCENLSPHVVLTSPQSKDSVMSCTWTKKWNQTADGISKIYFVPLCVEPRFQITRDQSRPNTVKFRSQPFVRDN